MEGFLVKQGPPTDAQLKREKNTILRGYHPREDAPLVAACAVLLPKIGWAHGRVSSNALIDEASKKFGLRLSVLTNALKLLEKKNVIQRHEDPLLGTAWEYVPDELRPGNRIFKEPVPVITEKEFKALAEKRKNERLERELDELRKKYNRVEEESPKWKWGKGDRYVKTPHKDKDGKTVYHQYFFDHATGECDCPSRTHTGQMCKHEIRRNQRANHKGAK